MSDNDGRMAAAKAAAAEYEQKIEQMSAAIKVMEGQLESVLANESSAVRAYDSVLAAIDSIRGIKASADNTVTEPKTLVQIGGGVIVPAKMSASDKMLLEVGSGVLVEKDPSYILDYLENRAREIKVIITNTGAEKTNLTHHIQQYRAQLEHALQTVYGGQAPMSNV